MSRASNDKMNGLHGIVADSLMAEIERYRAAGEPLPGPLLSSAIRFLKDNGVDSPGTVGSKIDRLAAALPSLDDLDNVVSFRK